MKNIVKDLWAMIVLLGSTAIRIIAALFQVVSWTTGKVYELMNKLAAAMLGKTERKTEHKIERTDY